MALSGGIYAYHDAIENEFQDSIYGIIFLFSSTWLSYQIPLINCFVLTKNEAFKPKDVWFVENKKLMLSITLFLLLISGYCFFQLKPSRQFIAILLGLISSLYVFPFYNTGLRKIPYLKIFLIAGSWACLSVFWWREPNLDSFILFLIRMTVIIAITLPFDMRDKQIDLDKNLKTIATTLTLKQLYICIFSLLSIALLLILAFKPTCDNEYIILFFASSSLIFIKNYKKDLFLYLALDGTFLLTVIVIYALKTQMYFTFFP